MWYFSPPCTPKVRDAMQNPANHLGCITTPKQGNKIPDRVPVIADNGLYGNGWVSYSFWLKFLEDLTPIADRVVFATAPDVFNPELGDDLAAVSTAESLPWLPIIRRLGFPAAFVAQNGLTSDMTPWDELDVLFIGGDDTWKLGPRMHDLAQEAVARGKKVHMGRVNSWERTLAAHHRGAVTIDGTYITFGPDINLPHVLGWMREINQQPDLFGDAA